MAKFSRVAGATSQSINVFIQNSSSTTGAGLTGLVFNTSGLTAYYTFTGANAGSTVITLATLAAVNSVWSSGGFKEIDSTNTPGLYRLDIPNAVIAASKGNLVTGYLQGAANMAPCPFEIELTGWDNQDGVHGGMSALPNTACTTNASLLTSGTSTDQLSVATGQVNVGKINGVAASSVTTINANIGTTQAITFDVNNFQKVDVQDWFGTVVATPATAGIPDINVKNVNNVTTTSVTTINAFLGTTVNPLFDGNSGIKADVIDWAGTAVNGTVPPDAIFLRSNTVQAGGASTITLDSGASATNNLYQNAVIFIRGGTGANQVNIIASYVGATKVATVGNSWAVQPDNTSTFTIVAAGPSESTVSGTVNANVTQWSGVNVITPNVNGVPVVDTCFALGTISAGAPGYFGVDWSAIDNPTATVALSATTISHLTNAPTSGNFTAAMLASLNAAMPASIQSVTNIVTGGAIATSGGKVSEVALVDTLTTYTGNTLQSGDAYAEVNSRLPAALTGSGLMKSDILAINGSGPAAAHQALAANVIYTGSVTATSSTTSIMDSSLTEAATGFWNGRIVLFTTGTLTYQGTNITNSAAGVLSVTALTGAPSIGDTYVIV